MFTDHRRMRMDYVTGQGLCETATCAADRSAKRRSGSSPPSDSASPLPAAKGSNGRVPLIIHRAFGFHSASAALARIMVTLGPIEHVLLQERTTAPDP